MALRIAEAIDGPELERETCAWSAQQFAALGDSLVWATARRARRVTTSFSANTNAPDGGIDAECMLPADAGESPFLAPGWNVFQYKKRDKFASDKKNLVSELKSKLRGALCSLQKKRGRVPARYIVCVNLDLTHDQKKVLRDAVLEGFERPDGFPDPTILGAADLASLLNDNPHLRAAYFQPTDFRTWETAMDALESWKGIGRNVELVGREELLKSIRELLNRSDIRVVVLCGPHDVGKSRLALEATRDLAHRVAVAADSTSLQQGDLRALVSCHQEIVCIAEDPEPGEVEALVQEAFATPNLKLLLTFPTPADAPKPRYGFDSRVAILDVSPLERKDSEKLIRSIVPRIQFDVEQWIIEEAGGIPGVIITAALLGKDLEKRMKGFRAGVGGEFANRIRAKEGFEAIKVLRLAAILPQLGAYGERVKELRAVCRYFGEGVSAELFLERAEKLAEARLMRRRGSFVEVTIPILATHLAEEAMGAKQNETLAFFAALSSSGQARLLGRLVELGDATDWFWNALFEEDGPLGRRNLLANASMLHESAGAAPVRTMDAIASFLDGISQEERRMIEGDKRRDFVHALEQLLFRMETSREALRFLGLLAEAENETWSNSATGVFAECFSPFHPQMPLPLDGRLEVLRGYVGGGSEQRRRVAIQAVREGIPGPGGGAVHLRRSRGTSFFDRMPDTTWGVVWEYSEALIEIAWELAKTSDTVGVETRSEIPRLLYFSALHLPPNRATPWFERLVEAATAWPIPLNAADVAEKIEWAIHHYDEHLAKVDLPTASRGEVGKAKENLARLLDRLNSANFGIRLRRWVGDYHYGDDEANKAIQALAAEVANQPDLLADDLWCWLASAEAKAGPAFFWRLGRADTAGRLRARVEAEGARDAGESPRLFAAYWSGWAEREVEAAADRLDEWEGCLTGKAVVLATTGFPATAREVDRLVRVIRNGRVPAEFVARYVILGSWLKPLPVADAARLFREIAGEDHRNGGPVMDLIHMWVHLDRSLEGEIEEISWKILEADPPVPHNEASDFDDIAARLASGNPERAFSLFERLIATERDKKWDPLEHHGGHDFWDALRAMNLARALRAVVRAAEDPVIQIGFVFDFKYLLDPARDRDAILEVARDSVEAARFLASCLSGTDEGFWSLAGDLTSLYPDDDHLWVEIAGCIEGVNEGLRGSYADFLKNQRDKVLKITADSATPTILRRRLRDWLARSEERIGRHVVWEYDEDIDDLMARVRDKGAPQRIWAIGRILKFASLEEIRRLLTVEEIEEALGQVDLPDAKRRMFEGAIPVWKHAR